MAEQISVSQISSYVGQEVTIKGWVYNRTDKGKLVFLLVRTISKPIANSIKVIK